MVDARARSSLSLLEYGNAVYKFRVSTVSMLVSANTALGYIPLIVDKMKHMSVPRYLKGAFLFSSTRSRLACDPGNRGYRYSFQLEDLHSYLEMGIVQMDDRLFAATPGQILFFQYIFLCSFLSPFLVCWGILLTPED